MSLADSERRLGVGSRSKTTGNCLSERALSVRSPLLTPSHCLKLSGSAEGVGSGKRGEGSAAGSKLWRLYCGGGAVKAAVKAAGSFLGFTGASLPELLLDPPPLSPVAWMWDLEVSNMPSDPVRLCGVLAGLVLPDLQQIMQVCLCNTHR